MACAIVIAFLVEPLALPETRDRSLFIFASLAYWWRTNLAVSPLMTRTILFLVSGAVIGAAGLSFALALRRSPSAASVRLASAFAAGALSAAIVYFVEPLPDFRSMLGLDESPLLAVLVRFAAYACMITGALQGLRFFLVYPGTLLEDDYRRVVESRNRDGAVAAATGWRSRIYPRWLKAGARPEAQQQAVAWAMQVFRWHESGRSLVAGIVLAAAGAATFRLKVPWDLMLVLPIIIAGPAMSMEMVRIQRDNGSADDRHRVGWIWGVLFFGGIVIFAIMSGGLALFLVLALVSPESLDRMGGVQVMTLPWAFGAPLFAALIVASFALSIFYRGTVDPNLAARKVTVWGVLGVLVVFLFVLIERAIASRVIAWLGLSPDSGAIVAGAGIAATIAPMRRRTENLVQNLAARYLPLDSLVQGERKKLAIAFSDLSGYTALSARDEASAHLLAALLQKQARIVSEKYGVRVVKAMGDAVMLETDSASSMASALLALHEAFAKAAEVIGLEPLPVHSGAHWGEVVEAADGDLYGQAVNLASRIQGEAKPGQIACSADFLDAAVVDRAMTESIGERKLKGVSVPMTCYLLRASSLAASAVRPSDPT